MIHGLSERQDNPALHLVEHGIGQWPIAQLAKSLGRAPSADILGIGDGDVIAGYRHVADVDESPVEDYDILAEVAIHDIRLRERFAFDGVDFAVRATISDSGTDERRLF